MGGNNQYTKNLGNFISHALSAWTKRDHYFFYIASIGYILGI